MYNKIKVGLVGYGVIGSALGKWIVDNNPNCEILISDPAKGYNDNLDFADIIFISIHIPTENDGTQDLSNLRGIISKLPSKPIFIRTTILPGTSENLSKEFNKKIYFMPEFLTERTAVTDFQYQPMVFTGEVELLKSIFVEKSYIEMSSKEAEIAKYAHNVFGAIKVTYFNGIYELAKKNGCDYEKVRQGVLLSSYINEPHTMVPGPDGKFGYGGKCFPKDVHAFAKFSETTPLGELIATTEKINKKYREGILCLHQ